MNSLKLSSVEVDLIGILSSLQVAMCMIKPDDYLKQLEHLRYCEKLAENARKTVKELKACQEQK